MGTPVIVVDAEKFLGFDEQAIERELIARRLLNEA